MASSEFKRLSRFTTLPILLDYLQRKRLTLLDPKLWEDRNDAEIILEYKRRKGIKNLFALCFSCNDGTVHHWKTYSAGPSGCMIEFNATKLLAIFEKEKLNHGLVVYKRLSDLERKNAIIEVDKIPFTKRWAYRCEEEYRIIYETNNNADFFDLEIPLDTIYRISISQQMPKPIYETIKQHLRSVTNNPDSKIHRSTLYENTRWINRFRKE